MDTVRFGRVLGRGARGAARVILAAADAAAAPSPRDATQPRIPVTTAEHTVKHIRKTGAELARGGRHFGNTAWKPFIRLGGVLWLELTGVFFGLFLLFAGVHAWKLRVHLHETAVNHTEHQHFLWSIVMAVLFGYFCVSSFFRASRRSRSR